MKTNWKRMAAGLAVLMGVSGVAFGQNRKDDRGHHLRVESQEGDRDYRGSNNRQIHVPYEGGAYNHGYYGDRDDRGQVDRGSIYNHGADSPYYGNSGNYGYYGNRHDRRQEHANNHHERRGNQ